MNVPSDIWNTTDERINEIITLGSDIISKALVNPTAIEVLDDEWFDSMFNHMMNILK